jgi:hypothetical protein
MSYWRSTFKEFLFMKMIGLIKILDPDAFVELQFSDADGARAWVASPEYAALFPVRSKAMRLTLFGMA